MTDMFEKYDNMPEFYVPNNREPHFPFDSGDEIVRGADATQVIIIPYKYSEMVKSATIFYYNKLHTVLERDIVDEEVKEHDFSSMISVVLKPDETLLFETGWDTFYQLKLILVDDSTIFTDKCRVKVFDTLEDKK